MPELLTPVIVWCLLITAETVASTRRHRRFEGALSAAGFVTSNPMPRTADVFRRPGAIISRAVTRSVSGVPTTFLFGSRPGVPLPLEGTFVNPVAHDGQYTRVARSLDRRSSGHTRSAGGRLMWRMSRPTVGFSSRGMTSPSWVPTSKRVARRSPVSGSSGRPISPRVRCISLIALIGRMRLVGAIGCQKEARRRSRSRCIAFRDCARLARRPFGAGQRMLGVRSWRLTRRTRAPRW